MNDVEEPEPGRCAVTGGHHSWRIQPALLDEHDDYRWCAACGRREWLP